MNILIVGGNGFIGRHIARAAQASGHQVVRGVRIEKMESTNTIACDLQRDVAVKTWLPRLTAIDAVINCTGILRASINVLQAVHCDAPAALAGACAELKKPFLHVSALGLNHAANTPYFTTKRDGENAIRAAHSGAIIVRPSVVFGHDSPATQLLLMQSHLPVLCLPTDTKAIAPIHVDDLAALCLSLIGTVRALGCDVDAVGAKECSIADYVQALRTARGNPRAALVRVPNRWMRMGLTCAAFCGARTITPEALDLMEHDHTGDARAFTRWMRRAPAAMASFQSLTH
jgi:uncharacterized protein YbjT (DUF2867 family)